MYNEYEYELQKLRKEDSIFNEMVCIIEAKIEDQIQAYNNTKTIKEKYSDNASIKIFVPAFPMTPIQRSYLIACLVDKYRKKISGDRIGIKKCIFSNRYKIFSSWN